MKVFTIFSVMLFIFLVIAGLGAFITQWAWNLVMPYLLKLPSISFWQAFGINVLIGMVRSVVVVKK